MSTTQAMVSFPSTLLSLFSFYLIQLGAIFLFSSFHPKMPVSAVPSPPILDATVNTHPIGTSDDEFDAIDSPLANEHTGSAVNQQLVELSHYCWKEVWMSLWKSADPKFPLGDKPNSHIRSLVASMSVLGFAYFNGMLTTRWSAE